MEVQIGETHRQPAGDSRTRNTAALGSPEIPPAEYNTDFVDFYAFIPARGASVRREREVRAAGRIDDRSPGMHRRADKNRRPAGRLIAPRPPFRNAYLTGNVNRLVIPL
jgi:hypothetical protein